MDVKKRTFAYDESILTNKINNLYKNQDVNKYTANKSCPQPNSSSNTIFTDDKDNMYYDELLSECKVKCKTGFFNGYHGRLLSYKKNHASNNNIGIIIFNGDSNKYMIHFVESATSNMQMTFDDLQNSIRNTILYKNDNTQVFPIKHIELIDYKDLAGKIKEKIKNLKKSVYNEIGGNYNSSISDYNLQCKSDNCPSFQAVSKNDIDMLKYNGMRYIDDTNYNPLLYTSKKDMILLKLIKSIITLFVFILFVYVLVSIILYKDFSKFKIILMVLILMMILTYLNAFLPYKINLFYFI